MTLVIATILLSMIDAPWWAYFGVSCLWVTRFIVIIAVRQSSE